MKKFIIAYNYENKEHTVPFIVKSQEEAMSEFKFYFGADKVEFLSIVEDTTYRRTEWVSYTVGIIGQGGHFSAEGYSKYNERWREKQNGNLEEEIYGIEQAKEHIEELRLSVYEGKKHYENEVFEIKKITAITEVIEQIKPTENE